MTNALDILANFFNHHATVEQVVARFPQFASDVPGTVMVATSELPSEAEQREFIESIPQHDWHITSTGDNECAKCGGWAAYRTPVHGCQFSDAEADEIKSLFSDLWKDEYNTRPSLAGRTVADMLTWCEARNA